ncbi:hypothetical protein BLNAU_1561 [Blattamonas nauphoetae]|uniref:Uncharacterized protein n=1 Tax=Blattamonas nauphoetae TaxID=2049346 RepID=A0ABQ9YIG8_9EUKA|nr:hypothetical protein BLNAU_1561 [Blattamonas nauphoetae]
MPFWMDAFLDALDEFSRSSATPGHSDYSEHSHISVLSTVFYDWIMKLIQAKYLIEPQPAPTPEDLYVMFITKILEQVLEWTNITCSSSEINDMVAQILDVYRPLTHSSFFAILWTASSSFSTMWDITNVLMQDEQVLFLQTASTIFTCTQDAFTEQRNIVIYYLEFHRSEWLFSDFLTVLQQLSKDDSSANDLTFLNKTCFSSAMKRIAGTYQSILNQPDTLPSTLVAQSLYEQHHHSSLVFREVSHLSTTLHDESTLHSTQNPTPSSFGDSRERTLDSEDTDLSTQMPSPPSHSSDIDDLHSESSISREEQRRKGSLRILNLIHEIRSRRIDTSETDWDATPFRDSGNFDESEIAPRDHFDDTIFDVINQFDIGVNLYKCQSICEETGNLTHLTITQNYLTKLTHFIVSETGFFGEFAAIHLNQLLSTVPDSGEIVSTVFPLLRNAFYRSNENACISLLDVTALEMEMNGNHSMILASWTDADWIAVFSFRWIRLRSLSHFLSYMVDILRESVRCRQSPSTSSLSLLRLFSASNHITSQSERITRINAKPDIDNHTGSHIILALILCHAVQDERLPSSLNDAMINFHHTDPSFSTLPLLFILLPAKHQLRRFRSSFHADFVFEKELSRMLLMFDGNCVQDLCILWSFFPPRDYLMFLHPFILRGLGSVLHQYKRSKTSTTASSFMEILLLSTSRPSSHSDSVQLFVSFPSDQIVEFSIALILDLFERSPFSTHEASKEQLSLQLITTLASHSLHTASATSLNRWFKTFHRLFLTSGQKSDEFESALWVLMTLCSSQLRLRLPPFAFDSLFGAVSPTLLQPPVRWNAQILSQRSWELFDMSLQTEMWSVEDRRKFRVEEKKRRWFSKEVLLNLVSHVPALRNIALVLLSRVCVQASRGVVLDLCRFGIVDPTVFHFRKIDDSTSTIK